MVPPISLLPTISRNKLQPPDRDKVELPLTNQRKRPRGYWKKDLSSLRNIWLMFAYIYFCLSVSMLQSLNVNNSRVIFPPEDSINNYPTKRIRRTVSSSWDSNTQYKITNWTVVQIWIHHFSEGEWPILPLRWRNDWKERRTDEK